MSNKKIMSVDELYEFCLKNNFAHFNSNEFGNEIAVRMKGNFKKDEGSNNKHTESLTPFVSRAFHDKVNLNKSEIPNDSFNENLPSANFRPILANITVNSSGEKDFGSHDYHIEEDENGDEKTVYDEKPVGVIDGSKTTVEYDKDADVNRAVLHGYLYNDYCQDAIDILNRRGTVDCSVELAIRDFSFNSDTRTLMINDFYVTALTLLSQDVRPGMAGSNFKIEDFAANTEQLNFNTDNKLIETLEKLTGILESFDINKNLGKEEPRVDNKDFEEVTENEEVTETEETTEEEVTVTEEESEETVDEASEEETDEDTVEELDTQEIKEETSIEEEIQEDSKDFSITVKYADKEFAISLQEKIYALSDLVNLTYADQDNTWYSVTAYDDYVIMCDWWSGKYFKQTYTESDGIFNLTGDRIPVFAEFVTQEELDSLNDMRSNYAAIKEELSKYQNAELHAQKEAIVSDEKYSVLTEKDEEGNFKNEAYAKLVSDMDNYSLTDLEKELKSVFADYITSGGQFAFNGKQNEKLTVTQKKFAAPAKDNTPSRYGNLFKHN